MWKSFQFHQIRSAYVVEAMKKKMVANRLLLKSIIKKYCIGAIRSKPPRQCWNQSYTIHHTLKDTNLYTFHLRRAHLGSLFKKSHQRHWFPIVFPIMLLLKQQKPLHPWFKEALLLFRLVRYYHKHGAVVTGIQNAISVGSGRFYIDFRRRSCSQVSRPSKGKGWNCKSETRSALETQEY